MTGSSIAMVATGPMPGSTPISVPRSTPIRHMMMLNGNVIDMPRDRDRLQLEDFDEADAEIAEDAFHEGSFLRLSDRTDCR